MVPSYRPSNGIARREFLQVGFSGVLGLGLPGLLAARSRAEAAPRGGAARAKSMILVFLSGGLSHIDSFDMKPDAPAGIRGEFQPIETNVAGLRICEHLPGLAKRADRWAVVRSMSHPNTNHLNATHQILTGQAQPGAFFDKIASRTDYPCYAAALDTIRPRDDGLPGGVMLPTFLMEGPLVWPGQHAGFLGPRHDPWQIRQDPNLPDFRVNELSLPDGFSVERLQQRRDWLDTIESERDLWGAKAEGQAQQADAAGDPIARQRDQAYTLLLSGKVARAFELGREDPSVRDRYGRHMFGQSLLLARRLIQAGVPIVQVNLGRVQNWDTHSGNFKSLKTRLLPPTDQGVSALLDDLAATGLLDETLVVVTGEFGRTPRIGSTTGNVNGPDGRDHWSKVFSALFAGAGVRGGQAIGQSDRNGAYPASRPFTPPDFAATIYRALGIDPATELRDRLNRPILLCNGSPIEPLYTGTTV
jgi:Protein of unknown function (DUF1501)